MQQAGSQYYTQAWILNMYIAVIMLIKMTTPALLNIYQVYSSHPTGVYLAYIYVTDGLESIVVYFGL